MFKNKLQDKLLTIFYVIGSKPLELFESHIENGSIERILDDQFKSSALEIRGANLSTTYIISKPLSIRLPQLVLIVRNLEKYFSFEVEICDSSDAKRRFRFANYQNKLKVEHFQCSMALHMKPNWNLISINLAQLVERVYATKFVECKRVRVNGNCRLRRIYFCDRNYANNELPLEYQVQEPAK